MDSYNIQIKRGAERELRRIPKAILKKLVIKIQGLSKNPRPRGVQKLKGDEACFRLRQGSYRVVYEIDDGSRIITVIKIGHRREVYG